MNSESPFHELAPVPWFVMKEKNKKGFSHEEYFNGVFFFFNELLFILFFIFLLFMKCHLAVFVHEH